MVEATLAADRKRNVRSLRVFLFGQPRIVADGRPFILSAPRKLLPLLGFLLLRRAAPISRDSLAFTLWPDDEEEQARAKLRSALHGLSRALPVRFDGRSWIDADAQTISWMAGHDTWLDFEAFEQCCASAVDREAGLAFYGGDLLEPVYDDWVIEHRERFRAMYLNALTDLIVEARSQRLFAKAAEYGSRILSIEPMREDIIRHVLSARYAAGDRAGALAEYEHFASAIRDEMGVDPMPETVALHDIILREAPLPADAIQIRTGDGAGDGAGRSSRPDLPFVGRKTELNLLLSRYGRAARGNGGLVFISGESGVGKSRLCAELALIAESEGARVLCGGTSLPERSPYECIADALRAAMPLVVAAEVPTRWLAALVDLLPEIRSHMPANVADSTTAVAQPQSDDSQLVEALGRVIGMMAAPRPLVIVADDLQWAKNATLSAISNFARLFARLPVLLVGTYREDDTAPQGPIRVCRRMLEREHLVETIALDRLSREDVTDLVARVPELAERSGVLANAIFERSDGNAFFVGELIRDRLETATGSAAAADLPALPAEICSTILARVGRASVDAQIIAAEAAVAGRRFSIEAVRDVLGWTEARVERSFDELLDRFVFCASGGSRPYEYAFSHQLVRSTLYDQIDEPTRRRRHHRMAQVLEQLYGADRAEQAAELARHFDAGCQPEKAAEYYAAAAAHAHSLGAQDQAVDLASRGLQLSHDARVRCELLRWREAAHAKLGASNARLADIQALEAEATAIGDDALLRHALTQRIDIAWLAGDWTTEDACIEKLLRDSLAAADARTEGYALRKRAARLRELGMLDRALADDERAYAAAAQVGEAPLTIDCLCGIAHTAAAAGDRARAYASLHEAMRLTEGPANLPLRGLVQRKRAQIYGSLLEFARALAAGKEALESFREAGDRSSEARTLNLLGTIYTELFDYESARAVLDESLRLNREFGYRSDVATALTNITQLEGNVGYYGRSIASGLEAEALWSELGSVEGSLSIAINLSDSYLHSGDFTAAIEHARRGLLRARDAGRSIHEAYLTHNLGAALREGGEAAAAVELFESGLVLARRLGLHDLRLGMLVESAAVRLSLSDARGARTKIDEYLGDIDAGAMLAPRQHQYGHWIAAQVYRANGDPSRTATLLARARELLDELAAQRKEIAAKEAFLSLGFNREIVEAFEFNRWPVFVSR